MLRNSPRTVFALSVALVAIAACSSPEEPLHVGYIEADWAYIAAPGSGWITEIMVSEGDDIAPGDLLFVLDDEKERAAVNEAEARVQQSIAQSENTQTGARAPEIGQLQAGMADAEAQLSHAARERDRILPLVERGLEPQSRGDQVVAAFERAEAGVAAAREAIASAQQAARPAEQSASLAAVTAAEAARANAEIRLTDREVQSRLSGRVEDLLFVSGEYVSAGQPVVSILPADALKVRFYVTQEELAALSIGEKVTVLPDGASAVSAEISYISTEAEFTPPVIYSAQIRDKLVFLVEADLPAGSSLRPGLPVDVDF